MKSQHDLNGYMDDPAECGYYDEYTAYDYIDDDAEYFADIITNLIKNNKLSWTQHQFKSPEYGVSVVNTYDRGAVSQCFLLESVQDEQCIRIRITEDICIDSGSADDKGNLELKLEISNPEMDFEYTFSLDDLPRYADLSAEQLWKKYKNNPFLILADAAIKHYTTHYSVEVDDLRKNHPYNSFYEEYQDMEMVRLGEVLRREQQYYLFHRCVLCPRTRIHQLQQYNILPKQAG